MSSLSSQVSGDKVQAAKDEFDKWLKSYVIQCHYLSVTDDAAPLRRWDRDCVSSTRRKFIGSRLQWNETEERWKTREGGQLVLEDEIWDFVIDGLLETEIRDPLKLYNKLKAGKEEGLVLDDVREVVRILQVHGLDPLDPVPKIDTESTGQVNGMNQTEDSDDEDTPPTSTNDLSKDSINKTTRGISSNGSGSSPSAEDAVSSLNSSPRPSSTETVPTPAPNTEFQNVTNTFHDRYTDFLNIGTSDNYGYAVFFAWRCPDQAKKPVAQFYVEYRQNLVLKDAGQLKIKWHPHLALDRFEGTGSQKGRQRRRYCRRLIEEHKATATEPKPPPKNHARKTVPHKPKGQSKKVVPPREPSGLDALPQSRKRLHSGEASAQPLDEEVSQPGSKRTRRAQSPHTKSIVEALAFLNNDPASHETEAEANVPNPSQHQQGDNIVDLQHLCRKRGRGSEDSEYSPTETSPSGTESQHQAKKVKLALDHHNNALDSLTSSSAGDQHVHDESNADLLELEPPSQQRHGVSEPSPRLETIFNRETSQPVAGPSAEVTSSFAEDADASNNPTHQVRKSIADFPSIHVPAQERQNKLNTPRASQNSLITNHNIAEGIRDHAEKVSTPDVNETATKSVDQTNPSFGDKDLTFGERQQPQFDPLAARLEEHPRQSARPEDVVGNISSSKPSSSSPDLVGQPSTGSADKLSGVQKRHHTVDIPAQSSSTDQLQQRAVSEKQRAKSIMTYTSGNRSHLANDSNINSPAVQPILGEHEKAPSEQGVPHLALSESPSRNDNVLNTSKEITSLIKDINSHLPDLLQRSRKRQLPQEVSAGDPFTLGGETPEQAAKRPRLTSDSQTRATHTPDQETSETAAKRPRLTSDSQIRASHTPDSITNSTPIVILLDDDASSPAAASQNPTRPRPSLTKVEPLTYTQICLTILFVSASDKPDAAPAEVFFNTCNTLEGTFSKLRDDYNVPSEKRVAWISAEYKWNGKRHLLRRGRETDWISFRREISKAWSMEENQNKFLEDGCQIDMKLHVE